MLSVKHSTIAGYGLYSTRHIKKGEIIMLWMLDAKLIHEDEYVNKLNNNDKQMFATGARYVGSIFLYTKLDPKLDRYDNYINHSFNPNVLYHCGVCFALCDILPGDELTTNYTYLIASGNVESFYDKESGREVCGLDPKACLLETTKKLLELLQDSQASELDACVMQVYMPNNAAESGAVQPS